MQNITIGRYNDIPADIPRPADGPVPVQDEYAGWIEGTREDGSTWVMFLDKQGNPECYWPVRADDGGVYGDPISLSA